MRENRHQEPPKLYGDLSDAPTSIKETWLPCFEQRGLMYGVSGLKSQLKERETTRRVSPSCPCDEARSADSH